MTRPAVVRAPRGRRGASTARDAARWRALCAALLSIFGASILEGGCGSKPAPAHLPPGAPIVLVVVDTLRADSLGVYGCPRATSAALDAHAERGAIFEHAFATAPWTLPSVASILTGRYPAGHGSGRGQGTAPNGRPKRVFTGIDAAAPRVATVLSNHGYATAALVTNTFLRPGFGVAQGFDRYDQSRNRYLDERRADVMVDRALEWIDGRPAGSPWFLLLHVLDPHTPYDPPARHRGKFTSEYQGTLHAPIAADGELVRKVKRRRIHLDDADRAFVRGVYDEEVAFVADEIARFLDGLVKRGVIERGLVVFTADHGEEFFDHGALEHGHSFYQELLRVPLLIWGHGVRGGRRDQPVSLVDVMPTVIDAAGIPVPAGLDGVSLWPLLQGGDDPPDRQLIAENNLYGDQRRAIVDWPYKLIVDVEHPEHLALYQLERDPEERHDVAAEHADVAQRLAAALGKRTPAATESSPVDIDEETESDLRALGYLR